MSAVFALGYAARGLRRGGQRTLLAAACVAFGVMSLVALQLLTGAFNLIAGIHATPEALAEINAEAER